MGRTVELGGFEIIHKIGEGGMGVVYKARQKSLDRIVAVKVLPAKLGRDTKFVNRFDREARSSAKLNHANVVQVFDVGVDRGLHYLAMEYVDGPSIKALLKQGKIFKEREALKIIRQMARALEYAEGVGLLHRDIKPDNILLSASGIAKLADLGLAKRLGEDSGLTVDGTTLGTPDYMSPEQAKGAKDLDIRSDLYSLGASLFHMVTGKPPFTGDAPTIVMLKHINAPPPDVQELNPKISQNCSKLIGKLLRKKREQRVQTPTELVEQIDSVLSGTAPESAKSEKSAKSANSPKRPAPKRRRADAAPEDPDRDWNKVLLYGGAVVGVLMLVAASVAILGRSRGRPRRRAAFEVTETSTRPDETPEPGEVPLAPSEEPPQEDELSELEKMYRYVQEWEKQNPDKHQELLNRYGKVKKAAEGTAAEFEIGDKVDVSMQSVRERMGEAAEEEWGRLEGETKILVDAGDYDGAIKMLSEVPEGLTELIGVRASARVDELSREVGERIATAIQRAERLLTEGRSSEGLRALAKVEKIKYAMAGERIKELKEKLSNARMTEAQLRRERQREETQNRLSQLLEHFNDALMEQDDTAAALAVARKAEKDRSHRPLRKHLSALKDVLTAVEELRKLERHAIEKLLGEDVNLKTKDGRTAEGIVQRVDEDTIYVEVPLPGGMGSALMPVKIEDLSEQQKKKFRGDYAPQTDAQKVAAALEKVKKGDLEGAEEMTGVAESYPIAAPYRKLLRRKRLGNAEVNAEEAWREIQDFVDGNRELTEELGKKLLDMLAGFVENHGATEFAETMTGRLSGLKSRAREAVTGEPGAPEEEEENEEDQDEEAADAAAEIQGVFNGKVESYNPKTREVSLFYDFKDPQQGKDWPGEIPVEFKRVARCSRAVFTGDIEFSMESGPDGGTALWRKAADSKWSLMRVHLTSVRGRKVGRGKSEGVAQIYQFSPGYKIVDKPYPFERRKKYTHTMRLSDGKSPEYWIDGKHEVVGEMAVSTGEVRLSVPSFTVTNVRIKGTLKKEWVEESLRK